MKTLKNLSKVFPFFTIVAILVFSVSWSDIFGQTVFEAPAKKLIDFGWHSPSIQDLQGSLELYENAPFDGLSIKMSQDVGGGNVFMVKDWQNVTTEAKHREIKYFASMKSSPTLTDNFLVLYGASQMDWFSDGDWLQVEDQLRFAAQLAQTAHCRGILWDPEPYKPGKNPWKYVEQENNARYSFDQYYIKVRKRGAQFIETLQNEFPGIIIFSLRELSDWQQGSPFSGSLLPVTQPEQTLKELNDAWWGLHPAFYVGILDAIDINTQFIDGNEEAYYYTSALEYFQIRTTLMDDAQAFIPPELRQKYHGSFRLGHAISAEYIAGNWLGMSPFPYRLTGQATMMTSAEKAKWFEHNAYYALRSSDEYAWLYTEEMNWWNGDKVPEGFKEALLSAKHKVKTGQPLGFEIKEIIQAAQDKADKFYQNK
ncbi:MAG: hypothetical protein EHM72_19880 [Calditrichaeota bacterium]|nr:MAG: hypothetical protein EHM72_19880 [Calditrichota bacterium]